MDEYLYDSQHHILGTVKSQWDNKQVLYDEHHQQMGFYDGNKNRTYDSYGTLLGEGNCLPDLPYVPRKLRFPLPELSRRSFTSHEIKRADSQQYWDDGRCRICTKNGKRICLVQGLPGMCETCYRFFRMYSRTDSFGLERKSAYHPITVQEIRKAVEKEKAPYLMAEQAADQAAKAALIQAVHETLHSSKPAARSNPTTASKHEKEKRGLRWYHWVLIVIMAYIILKFVLLGIVAYIMWKMGYID